MAQDSSAHLISLNPAQALLVVAAPSGAGKTSLVRALLAQEPRLRLSVSSTTRPMRPGETDGDHYHFVSKATFQADVERNAFLEHAQVFDNYYGTHRDHVVGLQDEGFDVLLEIDWQGAQQIRRNVADSVSIFILPPSVDALHQRLQKRGQDDEAVIARRMRDARSEMSHYPEFDYLVINDDFDVALAQLRCILHSTRLRRHTQQARHRSMLNSLLSD